MARRVSWWTGGLARRFLSSGFTIFPIQSLPDYLLYTLSACCFKEIHRSWLVQDKGRVRYRVVLQFPQACLPGEFVGATFLSLLQYVAVLTGCPTPDIRMLWCIYEVR